jgi:hypothetical protein
VRILDVRLYRYKPLDLDSYQRLAEEIIAICNEHPLKDGA